MAGPRIIAMLRPYVPFLSVREDPDGRDFGGGGAHSLKGWGIQERGTAVRMPWTTDFRLNYNPSDHVAGHLDLGEERGGEREVPVEGGGDPGGEDGRGDL